MCVALFFYAGDLLQEGASSVICLIYSTRQDGAVIALILMFNMIVTAACVESVLQQRTTTSVPLCNTGHLCASTIPLTELPQTQIQQKKKPSRVMFWIMSDFVLEDITG